MDISFPGQNIRQLSKPFRGGSLGDFDNLWVLPAMIGSGTLNQLN